VQRTEECYSSALAPLTSVPLKHQNQLFKDSVFGDISFMLRHLTGKNYNGVDSLRSCLSVIQQFTQIVCQLYVQGFTKIKS
jgi:hypothetical protein